MKKRLFAIALSLCMTLSLLPTAAFAAEGESVPTSGLLEQTEAAPANGETKADPQPADKEQLAEEADPVNPQNGEDGENAAASQTENVAMVGDQSYTNMQEALNAWAENGGELKLLADGEFSTRVTLKKDATLELNGHTLKTNVGQAIKISNLSVTLTVQDSSEGAKGVYESSATQQIFVNPGKVDLKSGTIKGVGDKKSVVWIQSKGTKDNIASCKVETGAIVEATQGTAVMVRGTKDKARGVLEVSGTVKSNDTAISVTNSANLVLDGGEQRTTVGKLEVVSTGSSYVPMVKLGNCVVSDLVVTLSGTNPRVEWDIQENARFAKDVTNVFVAAGTSYGCFDAGDSLYKVGQLTADTAVVAVLKEGQNPSYYGSLSGAVNSLEDSDTLQLLQDVAVKAKDGRSLPWTINSKTGSLTIDLNNHKVVNSDGTALRVSVQAKTFGTVTIKNGTLDGKTALEASVSGGCAEFVLENVNMDTADSPKIMLGTGAYVDGKADLDTNAIWKVDGINGSKLFRSFESAVAAENGVATLMKDYTGPVTLEAKMKCTMDLGGHTYTCTYSGNQSTLIDILTEGAQLVVKNGTLKSDTVTYAGIATNGSKDKGNINLTLDNVTLDVPNARGIFFPSSGSVTIKDSVINAKQFGVQMCAGSLTVEGDKTSITATGTPEAKAENDGPIDDGAAISIVNRTGYLGLGNVSITGGKFASTNSKAVKAYSFNNTDKTEGAWDNSAETIQISGGYFTSDPSKWVENGKVAVTTKEDGYRYEIAKLKETVDLDTDLVSKVDVSAGESKVGEPAVTDNMTQEVKNAMTEASEQLKNAEVVDGNKLSGIANLGIDNGTLDVNKAVNAKKDEIQTAVDKANHDKDETEAEVKAVVTVTPYMEIKVTDAVVGTNSKPTSVTMDVTPKIEIKAEVENKDNTKTVIDLGTQNLTITEPIEMTLPCLVEGDQFFVQHKGYEYKATKNGAVVEFTNPHGFSEFTVNSASQSVTSITKDGNTTRYVDLGLAIDEADAGTTLYVSGRANNKSYTTNGKDGKTVTLVKASTELGDYTFTINGTAYTPTREGVSFTNPRYSSSSGGGSASTGYTVTAPSAKNGSVSVTPKNASKGDTVTVTVKADKGYELSKLTVTDKDGKTVKLTDKGNGKYTFAMPGSKVEVKAEFVEISTETENPFRDVNKNAYYYNQVLWAVEKGITSGVSANEFAPEAACTRAQMVTFLWKAAGSPEVSGALAFNDVSSDAYYAKAVRWAAQQGITSGTSAGVFSPDAPCTRGQMAMFLYAYAKTPAATGSVPFGDVASSDYFNTAVLWAVNNGITSGTSSTTYSPASVCTRGQMVVFLYQLLNK